MSTPKHRTIPGCSYFVTTKCWQGRSAFSAAENAEILLETLFHYRDVGAYLLHEFVVMPDHIHLLLTPGATTSLEKAVQLIKGGSSHRIHAQRQHRSEIWQIGFYDWTVRDSTDWNTKVEYIRMNPVRAKLVASAEDWPYSSASGRFRLDPMPSQYSRLTSGAKAPTTCAETVGIKPYPPEKQGSNEDRSRYQQYSSGAKAPTTCAETVGIKPHPPEKQGSNEDRSRYQQYSSGAKAPIARAETAGLKPRPPKTLASGAKAPTEDRPFVSELKLRPPKRRVVHVTSPEVIGKIQVGREGGE